MKSTVVIPDTQIRHGVQTWHLPLIGRYIADHQPDSVVMLGDWFDHMAISKYPDGKIGRLYQRDVDAGVRAMEQLLDTIQRRAKGYKGRFIFTTGNHDYRLQRYIAEHPELAGALHDPMDTLADMGWRVIPFLEVVMDHGVAYSHYFPRSAKGTVMQGSRGAPDARAQLLREMRSCTGGHQQGFSYYEHPTGNRVIQSMIAGSCYVHDEKYLTPQGQVYFQGIIHKVFTSPGVYDFKRVSLQQLRRMYA